MISTGGSDTGTVVVVVGVVGGGSDYSGCDGDGHGRADVLLPQSFRWLLFLPQPVKNLPFDAIRQGITTKLKKRNKNRLFVECCDFLPFLESSEGEVQQQRYYYLQ